MNATIALTISPPNRTAGHKMYSNPNYSVYVDDLQFIQLVMAKSRIKTYEIYPEFDDKGRLHYHGIVHVDYNQKVRFYKYTQIKLTTIGFVDISTLKTEQDIERWMIYITKGWDFTKQVLEITECIRSKEKQVQKVDKPATPKEPSILDYMVDQPLFSHSI